MATDVTSSEGGMEEKAVTAVAKEQMKEKKSKQPRASSAPGKKKKANKPFKALGVKKKSWQSNTQVNRLVQMALLKTLLHAIRNGSVEGVRVAIERGVSVHYVDSRQRNLIMHAAKHDTDARLRIVIILADAGCDVNHRDQLGWSCLHYACASGALDVAKELVRRDVSVDFNPYGYGPEEFVIPKVSRAKSLLQQTEQLQHEHNVKQCWDYFRRQTEKAGYAVKCRSNCDLGKPLKVQFQAPEGHSEHDRIRIMDVNLRTPLWQQVSKNFSIPPGTTGSITLDAETLDQPSLYRICYEKYEPVSSKKAGKKSEKKLEGKVSARTVNDMVMTELQTSDAGKSTKQTSRSSRAKSPKSVEARRKSSAQQLTSQSAKHEHHAEEDASSDLEEIQEEELSSDDSEFESVAEDTITAAAVADHPSVSTVTGVHKIVAMAVVSVSTLKTVRPNEYEVIVRRRGAIGLTLEPKPDSSKLSTHLIVRRSSGQAATVSPGDSLVAIGNSNIEHAGLRHTLWELNGADRPLTLRFRRGNAKAKSSLFSSLRSLSSSRPAPTISV